MKKLISYSLLIGAFMGVSSCNFINEDVNIDPNNPVTASMANILPSPIVNYAYAVGGDFGRITTIMTQQHGGADRQHAGYDSYSINESATDNTWQNVYTKSLKNLNIIQKTAADADALSPHYSAVAKIQTALILGQLTDLFNDIPYSDAFQGETANFKPKFDKAADVYTTVDGLLAAAITDADAAASTFKPGADDVIYAGDMTKWKAAANSLRARNALHLSKLDPGAYAKALGFISGAIASNAGDAQVTFGTDVIAANPWFQFEDQRGDVVMGKKLMDLMNNQNDPRLPAYATKTDPGGLYVGMEAGDPDNTVSRFGPFYGKSASPIPLITFVETKFIEAECAFQTGAKERAATAYNDAIKASLAKFGTPSAAFETAVAGETMATITLEKIMTQKYIALYSQLEPFNDWRRTGIPALSPAAGQNAIPRRLPYPQSERLFNGTNMPSGVTIFDRVFWDK
jgi:hypothetical protein